MRNLLSLTTCLATLACGISYAQSTPGDTLDRAAAAIDQSAERISDATDQAARRTADAARSTFDRNPNAQTDTDLRVNTDTQTDTLDSRTSTRFDQSRDHSYQAESRTFQQPSDHWSDASGNQWNPGMNQPGMNHPGMYQPWHGGTYPSQDMATNRVYTLRYDAGGREFICVNGQRVYFDHAGSQNSADQQGMAANQQDERYRAAYGSYDSENDSDDQPMTDQPGDANQQRDLNAITPDNDQATRPDASTSGGETKRNAFAGERSSTEDIKQSTQTDATKRDAAVQTERDQRDNQAAPASNDLDATIDTDADDGVDVDIDAKSELNRQPATEADADVDLNADVDAEADLNE